MIIEHNEHPIERIMDNACIKLKGLVSADTVVRNPVTKVTPNILLQAEAVRVFRLLPWDFW